MNKIVLALALTTGCLLNGSLAAETVSLSAVADTTLIELVPDNNMGGHPFFNAGTTLNRSRNRGLLQFDVTSIPQGSHIESASLVVEVVGIPTDEPASSAFRLHRILKPWGEGNKTSYLGPGPGRGALATEGEATWNHRFALSTNEWSSPGGAADVDYASATTAELFIYDVNQYTFGPTAQMASDVQLWINDPTQNFGWLLKTENEEIITTARRFASSEDVDYAPQLVVEFTAPPRIFATKSGSEVHLRFQTRANEGYTLQSTEFLGGNPVWTTLTNVQSSTLPQEVAVTNAVSAGSRYFRLLIAE